MDGGCRRGEEARGGLLLLLLWLLRGRGAVRLPSGVAEGSNCSIGRTGDGLLLVLVLVLLDLRLVRLRRAVRRGPFPRSLAGSLVVVVREVRAAVEGLYPALGKGRD